MSHPTSLALILYYWSYMAQELWQLEAIEWDLFALQLKYNFVYICVKMKIYLEIQLDNQNIKMNEMHF